MSYLKSTLSDKDWLERVYQKSKSTRSVRCAESALKAFDNFCLEKCGKDYHSVIMDLKGNSGDALYVFLSNFVSYMTIQKSPKTVQTYFGLIRSYLRSQGIKTNSEDIKDFVRFPTKIKERRKALTIEIIRKLLDNAKEQRKALYLTLLSSGMRVGEALALRKRDFDFSSDPVTIHIPARYTKTREARETYISKEAKELVLRLVKRKNESDTVFTNQTNNVQAVENEQKAFGKLRNRCNFLEKYSDGKRFVVNIHAFRSYFHTKASQVHGVEYSNALDGHSGYLPQYYRLTSEERTAMFKDLEPHLLIYENPANMKQINELQAKMNELENKKDEVEKIEREKRFSELEENTKKLSERIQALETNKKETHLINSKINEIRNMESDPSNLHFPGGGPFDTRLVNLQVREINEGSMIIFDTEFEESIKVVLKGDKVFCTLDKSNDCKHVLFALANPKFYETIKKNNINVIL